jgi:hypothetical protein
MNGCANSAFGCRFKRIPKINNKRSRYWIGWYPITLFSKNFKTAFWANLVNKREPSAGIPMWTYTLTFTFIGNVILGQLKPMLWA